MTGAAFSGGDGLRRAGRTSALGLVLLAAAGFRHHLVWGESERLPWLLPLLNAAEALAVVGFVALAGSGFWRAMRSAGGVDGAGPHAAQAMRRVVWWGTALVLLAVLVPCFLTADPIDYVARGRVLGVHGGNPYLDVPSRYVDDPFVAFGDRAWKDVPLPYGPVVANLQGAVAVAAHALAGVGGLSARAELVVALVLFKLLFGAAVLAAAHAMPRLARALGGDRAAEVRAFVAVAWNPLVLCDCVANAHNDALLVPCLVLAAAGAVTGRVGVATIALGLGTLVKFVPALLGPALLAVAVRRRRLPAFAAGACAVLALAALGYLQFFTDPRAFEALRQQGDRTGGSLAWALHAALGLDLGSLVTAGRALVVTAACGAAVLVWRRPEPRVVVSAAAGCMLLLAVAGAALFGTWYHVWWVPLALALGRGYLFRAALVASVVSPLAYLVWAGMRRFDEPSQWCVVAFGVAAPLLLALRAPPRDGAAA